MLHIAIAALMLPPGATGHFMAPTIGVFTSSGWLKPDAVPPSEGGGGGGLPASSPVEASGDGVDPSSPPEDCPLPPVAPLPPVTAPDEAAPVDAPPPSSPEPDSAPLPPTLPDPVAEPPEEAGEPEAVPPAGFVALDEQLLARANRRVTALAFLKFMAEGFLGREKPEATGKRRKPGRARQQHLAGLSGAMNSYALAGTGANGLAGAGRTTLCSMASTRPPLAPHYS
jgi:hypothetical protein